MTVRLRGNRDGGTVHVLEAAIVATVMISSVAFVVTYKVSPVDGGGSREPLAQKASDILAILNDTPVLGSDLGTNVLSVSLMECLQGNCTMLTDRMEGLLPEGAYYAVYLSNGEGLYPVHAARDPGGEAVTARRLIEPAWSYQFMETSQSAYNPVEDPVVVYALPVFSSNPVYQGGSSLTILVTGNRTADNAGYVMKGAATTRVGASTDSPSTPAVSVYFHDGSGTALASRDLRAQTLTLGAANGENVSMSVRVKESGGGTVPNGTTLTVHLPHGWQGSASAAANAASWSIASNATDRNASRDTSSIVARLTRDVSSGTVDFVFDASYWGDANDYYPFVAALSSGAYAQGSLLVRADVHPTQSSYEVPSILASVPRPLGATATTTWTLSAFAPEAIAVTRIEVIEEQGRDIFGTVSGLSGPGSWSSEGSKLVWTGSLTLGHDAPLNLTFDVTASGQRTMGRETAPFVPSVDFGNWTGRLLGEVSPGLYRGVFLPADSMYRGYNSSTGVGLRLAHPAESAAVYKSTALPGSTNYTVGYVTGLKDSLFGSDVRAAQRFVPHGGTATLSVDVQSVMYKLALLGFTPSVDVYVYPPWAANDRTDVYNATLYDGAIASGGGSFLSVLDLDGDLLPDATNVGRHDVEVPIPNSWLYGPYVVEVRVSWAETLSSVVDGVPLTEDILREARVYDYFVVKPSNADLPSSPLYDVHLVAWYGDWG